MAPQARRRIHKGLFPTPSTTVSDTHQALNTHVKGTHERRKEGFTCSQENPSPSLFPYLFMELLQAYPSDRQAWSLGLRLAHIRWL